MLLKSIVQELVCSKSEEQWIEASKFHHAVSLKQSHDKGLGTGFDF